MNLPVVIERLPCVVVFIDASTDIVTRIWKAYSSLSDGVIIPSLGIDIESYLGVSPTSIKV